MDDEQTVHSPPVSGKVPYALGQASVVRIPVPSPGGLCIEFRPRGHVPASGSTSTLFIQDLAGKKQLRLDYGWNKTTNTIATTGTKREFFRSLESKTMQPSAGQGGLRTTRQSTFGTPEECWSWREWPWTLFRWCKQVALSVVPLRLLLDGPEPGSGAKPSAWAAPPLVRQCPASEPRPAV
jgi:hypothetical protein